MNNPNKYNAVKLDKELRAAGFAIDGCNSKGVVFWVKGYNPSPAELEVIDQILAAHDPTPEPDSKKPVIERLKKFREKAQDAYTAEEALDDVIELIIGGKIRPQAPALVADQQFKRPNLFKRTLARMLK